jgi:hypothetical protein
MSIDEQAFIAAVEADDMEAIESLVQSIPFECEWYGWNGTDILIRAAELGRADMIYKIVGGGGGGGGGGGRRVF